MNALNAAPATLAARALRKCTVAVIGAGAAGLVAARELKREGHSVTVFEQNSRIGGVWVYDDRTEEDDLLGKDMNRKKVHSSMYRQLRTNLPREIMGFSDFPFTTEVLGNRSVDPRRFCNHAEVLCYLEAFADHFQLQEHIKFNTKVQRVQLVKSHIASCIDCIPSYQTGSWQVSTCSTNQGCTEEVADQQSVLETYDAVVVCNGHYSQPNIPDIKGIDIFPGFQMHSHNYREPKQFKDQIVLVVGASNSGEDISREVASVASQVHVCARSWKRGVADIGPSTPYGLRTNMYRHTVPSELTQEGEVLFPDGTKLPCPVHSIIFCTGYQYTFPFMMDTAGLHESSQSIPDCSSRGPLSKGMAPSESSAQIGISVHDQRVQPLWLHMFPPGLSPSLSFLGLPWKVVPFPQQELQAKLVARALSGRVQLPSIQDMWREINAFYDQLEQQKIATRYTHMQGASQWDYNDRLAILCGPDVIKTAEWRIQMYNATSAIRELDPESYRDIPLTCCDGFEA
ncbi:hypothetical protein CEUSTIGMA_g7292.t1 [Chlamydomonas eustigma]|uniref:Flavin-containing monooxygenase n=1 Tax=Chlamydomonas eustigma TaxID=1157962 RepID=A0A250XAG7_9CHLO|nr:hypothetical protein CEUSTIGMA_g7292.t1 [Chlamydomonas eustigma]|eukprot:GAX79852.1 hypothetical protein CEUSTIGMA_g7292.t1 [Chlamydomonas eustigma]